MSKIGHPWVTEFEVTDVVVYRFSKGPDALKGNSQSDGKWLHSLSEAGYLSMSDRDKVEFSKIYGRYLTKLEISYGEVVGMRKVDTTFLREHVVSTELIDLGSTLTDHLAKLLFSRD